MEKRSKQIGCPSVYKKYFIQIEELSFFWGFNKCWAVLSHSGPTDRQTDRLTGGWTNKQTNWRTDRATHWWSKPDHKNRLKHNLLWGTCALIFFHHLVLSSGDLNTSCCLQAPDSCYGRDAWKQVANEATKATEATKVQPRQAGFEISRIEWTVTEQADKQLVKWLTWIVRIKLMLVKAQLMSI